MKFAIFKKKEDPKVNGNNDAYSALVNGLNEMDRKGVDRVILTMYESGPDKNATGRWNSTDDSNYYPIEMLDDGEQGMIKEGKHYTVIALVRDNVGDIVKYRDRGLEVTHRTHVFPMLPKLKEESQLNYITQGGVYSGEDLKQFIEGVAGNGWNPEAIDQRVKSGIEEYHSITHKLMDSAGVYAVLERMGKEKYSHFEQLMNDMRANISQANK